MDISSYLYEAKYWIAAQKLRIQILKLMMIDLKANFDPNGPRNKNGEWTRLPNGALLNLNALTGNKRIDSTTYSLIDVVNEVSANNGAGTGPLYGIEIHTKAAALIRSLDLPGVGTYGFEQSFSAGDTVRYGLDGSIRTDVVLRNGRSEDAPIMAVYDIKTGNAKLTPSRVKEIRDALGIDESVPVIQIHILRGTSAKSPLYIY